MSTVAVTMNEILLRGCTLKNSGRVHGCVIYTGPESRIQMNAASPPRKLGALPDTFRLLHEYIRVLGSDIVFYFQSCIVTSLDFFAQAAAHVAELMQSSHAGVGGQYSVQHNSLAQRCTLVSPRCMVRLCSKITSSHPVQMQFHMRAPLE